VAAFGCRRGSWPELDLRGKSVGLARQVVHGLLEDTMAVVSFTCSEVPLRLHGCCYHPTLPQ